MRHLFWIVPNLIAATPVAAQVPDAVIAPVKTIAATVPVVPATAVVTTEAASPNSAALAIASAQTAQIKQALDAGARGQADYARAMESYRIEAAAIAQRNAARAAEYKRTNAAYEKDLAAWKASGGRSGVGVASAGNAIPAIGPTAVAAVTGTTAGRAGMHRVCNVKMIDGKVAGQVCYNEVSDASGTRDGPIVAADSIGDGIEAVGATRKVCTSERTTGSNMTRKICRSVRASSPTRASSTPADYHIMRGLQ